MQKTSEELSRAAEAKRIIENTLYKEAWDGIRKDFMKQWESSPVRDVEGRESIWLALRIMDKIQSHFEQIIDTGRMASIELEKSKR